MFQIRVNAINPTVVMTSMGRHAWSDPAKAGPLLSRIPLGRFAGMKIMPVTRIIIKITISLNLIGP